VGVVCPKVSAAALTPRHDIVAFSGRWPGTLSGHLVWARYGLCRTSSGHNRQLATLPLIHLHQSDVFDSVCDYLLSLEERSPSERSVTGFHHGGARCSQALSCVTEGCGVIGVCGLFVNDSAYRRTKEAADEKQAYDQGNR
jgi:hypothetical protein